MVLRCIWSIELIGVETYGKMGEKHIIWAFRVTCTGTLYVLVIFGQCVPVHVRGVPVHPVLFSQFRPVFVFWL